MAININFLQLTKDILPPTWRNEMNFDFMKVCLKALHDDIQTYNDFQNLNRFDLLHNSGCLSFSHWLTVKMGFPITVGSGIFQDPTFMWFQDEIESGSGYPTYLSFMDETEELVDYIYFQDEMKTSTYDFYVSFDSNYATDDNLTQITALVDQMKLGGVSWIFIYN